MMTRGERPANQVGCGAPYDPHRGRTRVRHETFIIIRRKVSEGFLVGDKKRLGKRKLADYSWSAEV